MELLGSRKTVAGGWVTAIGKCTSWLTGFRRSQSTTTSVGWDAEPYMGAEIYEGYGDYRVNLTVPNGWTLMATGRPSQRGGRLYRAYPAADGCGPGGRYHGADCYPGGSEAEWVTEV